MPPSAIDSTRAALRYVPGTGPVALHRLGSGLVNESFRVERGGRVYSLRVPAAEAADLGLDREWECRVLERAGACGLAPYIECCEPRQGVVVARWVPGCAWTPEQARRTENVEKIAQLACRVHALPPPAPARVQTPAGWIAHYREALVRRGADPLHPLCLDRRRFDLTVPVGSRLQALAALAPAPPVLCHSDLHAQNLVLGDRQLVLLDWEYAHVSEAFWDLAGWSCNSDLSAEARAQLLAAYLGRPPTGEDAMRLGHLSWLYDYVCVLWSELYLSLRGGSADSGIGARARILAARLSAAA
jgi:thiamine kinase